MAHISSIYSATDRPPSSWIKRQHLRSKKTKLRAEPSQHAERLRLVRLVRINGFPECKQDCCLAILRAYLDQVGVSY